MQNNITAVIKSTIIEYETKNQLSKFWKEPIIEIISANDNRLLTLKETVSTDHLMPCDILHNAKSIVSFFIPFQDYIVDSNINGKLASQEWAAAYVKTNDLIKTINDNIEILMEQNGYKAGKIPATHNFNKEKLISNWSHRHIAYMAGLGTFGMNNMLITKNGCCGRFGSIVVNYEPEEYKQIHKTKEKCLKKQNGSCGLCQKRCVVNAYEGNTFSRQKCYRQCLENAELYKDLGKADVCGKCLLGLPCSTREP